MNKLFFIHTHYIPKTICDSSNIVGALIVPEMYSNLMCKYYNLNISMNSIVDFLNCWELLKFSGGLKLNNVIFAIENNNMIQDVCQIKQLYSYGVRSIQLFHSKDNKFYSLKNGLTDKGKELLKEMIKLNMILDLSHLPDQEVLKIADIYEGKKTISHVVCSDNLRAGEFRSNSLERVTLEKISNKDIIVGIPFVNNIVLKDISSKNVEQDDIIMKDIAEHILTMTSILGKQKVAIAPDFFDVKFFSKVFNENLKFPNSLFYDDGFTILKDILRSYELSETIVDNIFYLNASKFFLELK